MNTVVHFPGPDGFAREAKSPLESFGLFVNDTIIQVIVSNINAYINSICSSFNRKRDANTTDER